jgi:hypothetical protein
MMMEAVSISETSVSFYRTTRGKIPEDNDSHTRRLENLNSYFNKPLYSTKHVWITKTKQQLQF